MEKNKLNTELMKNALFVKTKRFFFAFFQDNYLYLV